MRRILVMFTILFSLLSFAMVQKADASPVNPASGGWSVTRASGWSRSSGNVRLRRQGVNYTDTIRPTDRRRQFIVYNDTGTQIYVAHNCQVTLVQGGITKVIYSRMYVSGAWIPTKRFNGTLAWLFPIQIRKWCA
jgi:hypothetical protein